MEEGMLQKRKVVAQIKKEREDRYDPSSSFIYVR